MNKIILALSLLLSSLILMSQNNLIHNAGFEDGNEDPDHMGLSRGFEDHVDVWENEYYEYEKINSCLSCCF